MPRRLFVLAVLLGLLTACGRDERASVPPDWYHPDPGLFRGPGHVDPDDGFFENLARADARRQTGHLVRQT